MKIKAFLTLVLSSAMFLQSIATAAGVEEAKKKEYSSEYNSVEIVADYATQLYLDEGILPEELIKDGLSKMLEENPEQLTPFLKTMLSTLDPYSEYFTLEEYTQYVNDLNRAFYGIGVMIQKIGDYVQVTGFTNGSPSEAAGIQIGDKVAMVNGTEMKGKNMNEVRAQILGELGTTVTITMLRGDSLIDFTITRSLVNENTVECDKIDDNIAYISISDMAANTASEFSEALAQVDSWGIKNIILDLRNNGGGYLSSAIEIAGMIVPDGLIVKTVYRNPYENEDYYSELSSTKYNFNILVNENTASAAEILASAMQDSKSATLIGKKTFGKAVIQKVYRLINQSVIKLTVGRYITRNGNEINEVGISPDIKVSNITNPIDTKKYYQFDYKTKNVIGAVGDNVRAAKERLYLLGFYDGSIDDNFDSSLFDAVVRFQADNELYPYGVLDITTQVKIENTFAKLEVLEDLQLKEAVKLFGGNVE